MRVEPELGWVEVRVSEWGWQRVNLRREGVMAWPKVCREAERLAWRTGQDHRAVEAGGRENGRLYTVPGRWR